MIGVKSRFRSKRCENAQQEADVPQVVLDDAPECPDTAPSPPHPAHPIRDPLLLLPLLLPPYPAAVRFSRALCTCASDAAAIGFSSNSANTSASGRRSCASTRRLITANGRGGTWSCNRESTSMYSSGTRSGRDPMICPNLISSPWRRIASSYSRCADSAWCRDRRSAASLMPSRFSASVIALYPRYTRAASVVVAAEASDAILGPHRHPLCEERGREG